MYSQSVGEAFSTHDSTNWEGVPEDGYRQRGSMLAGRRGGREARPDMASRPKAATKNTEESGPISDAMVVDRHALIVFSRN